MEIQKAKTSQDGTKKKPLFEESVCRVESRVKCQNKLRNVCQNAVSRDCNIVPKKKCLQKTPTQKQRCNQKCDPVYWCKVCQH